MISLITSHVSVITLIIMTFFVNARHIFYGLGFIEKFRKMKWCYPYMIFSLTDETYSILCSVKYDEGINEQKAAFFLVVIVNQWKEYKTKLPFIISAFCALTFLITIGPNKFLIPALSTSTVLLIILNKPISLSDKRLLKKTAGEN